MLGHRSAERYPGIPQDWTVVDRHAIGPFTTHVAYRRPDGEIVRWSSRFARKHASRLSRATRPRGRWWAPRHASWWIGVLFAIGSLCFFLGPFPGFAGLVGSAVDGAVFFVGSVFFTAAALLQYLEAANADRDPAGRRTHRIRLITFEPGRIDWWATLIQLAGTIFFNINTYRAMQESFDTSQVDRLVWAPEAVGSICFLVAGLLAYIEVRGGGVWRAERNLEWKIATINFLGCILFGVSAVAGFIVPDTGDVLDLAVANVTTSLGALCFLTGAVLLLPEGAEVTT